MMTQYKDHVIIAILSFCFMTSPMSSHTNLYQLPYSNLVSFYWTVVSTSSLQSCQWKVLSAKSCQIALVIFTSHIANFLSGH
jgi:hypothetical protein